MHVHIIAKSYHHGNERFTVLCDGEVYAGLRQSFVECLQEGMTPDELELTPDSAENGEF